MQPEEASIHTFRRIGRGFGEFEEFKFLRRRKMLTLEMTVRAHDK